MPSLKNKENKLKLSELDILLIEMGFFRNLKGKEIRFNLKPFSNPEHLANNKPDIVNQNLIDLHLEIAKKVDELLEKHELALQMNEPEPMSVLQEVLPLREIVEMREPTIKKPDMPVFKTEINSNKFFGELSQNEDFFEIVPPDQIPPENEQTVNNNIQSWMLGNQDKSSQKSVMGLGRIKVRTKDRTSNKKTGKTENTQKNINGVTKTQIELEKSKEEIESRKRALEEAKKLEKAKEEELKRKREEKKKEEKFKEIEAKKRLKQEKLRAEEEEKAEKLREKELRLQEIEKQKQEKIKAIERKKAEQLKAKELIELEKQKQKEEQLKNIEGEKTEKEKEIELKKMEMQKQKEEQLKNKETKKLEKQKHKELEKLEKEKRIEEQIKNIEKEKAEKQRKKELEKLEKEKQKELERKKKEEEKSKSKEPDKKDVESIAEEEPEETPPTMDKFVKVDEEKEEKPHLDDEVEKLIPIIDELLEKLPDEVIDEFAQSEDFVLYEKVVTKYKRK